MASLRGAARDPETQGPGRPPNDPLLMFKALLLQQWYRLSDADLEEALNDRMSFRRFLGLSLEDASPDHTTLVPVPQSAGGRRDWRRGCLPSSSGSWSGTVCC